MQIPIHSVVDLITNSSTVIYTQASNNAIKTAKEIINLVLKEAGTGQDADDLFDFRVVYRPVDLVDWLSWEAPTETGILPNAQDLRAARDNKDYFTRSKAILKYSQDNRDALEEYFDNWPPGRREDEFHDKLIITTKAGADTKFADKALSMFIIDSEYDG